MFKKSATTWPGRSAVAAAALGAVVLLAGCGQDEREAREERIARLRAADVDTVVTTDRTAGRARGQQELTYSDRTREDRWYTGADTSEGFRRQGFAQQGAWSQDRSGLGEPGRHSLALPTGRQETSAILVEKTMPTRVVAGEVTDYTIEVTNLTQQPLANVWVMETADQGLAFVDAQEAMRGQSATGRTGDQTMQQRQMQPGQTQPDHMRQPPQGQMHSGQMQPGQMHSQMQPGQMQPGQMHRGQMQQQHAFQSRMQSPYQQRWELTMLEPGQTQTIHVYAVPRQLGQITTTLTAGYEPSLVARLEVLAPGQEYIQIEPGPTPEAPVTRRAR